MSDKLTQEERDNMLKGESVEADESLSQDIIQPIKEEVDEAEGDRTVENSAVSIQKPKYQELTQNKTQHAPRNLDLIMDVPLDFSVVLGKSKKTIKNVLSLSTGSVVELDKMTDEPLEIHVNGKLIAKGEVVVINESFGIRITNIQSKEQRVRHLNTD